MSQKLLGPLSKRGEFFINGQMGLPAAGAGSVPVTELCDYHPKTYWLNRTIFFLMFPDSVGREVGQSTVGRMCLDLPGLCNEGPEAGGLTWWLARISAGLSEEHVHVASPCGLGVIEELTVALHLQGG